MAYKEIKEKEVGKYYILETVLGKGSYGIVKKACLKDDEK